MLLRGKKEKQKKECGILLHISSLPSRYGIGTFGDEAYRFVDFLKQSHQKYWQILPLCPIGEGNSPYKSTSAFAGEILFTDLELLVKDGLLEASELQEIEFPKNVDYRRVKSVKLPLLRKAAENFNTRNRDYLRFLKLNDYWLNDFALFMAIKEANQNAEFYDFEDGLKYRMPMAVESFRSSHYTEISFYKITQFLFYSQYLALKAYANKNGIKIIGDIPFYVSLDSADVWKNPDVFKLGRDMTPVLVAGVPPDIFSSDGQLWGNPIYDWDFQKKTNFFWWRQRLKHCAKLYDVIRIDHFRAFADYYTIPFGSITAQGGTWEKGVGIGFWKTVKESLGELKIIAEDLGGDTPEVEKLVNDTGFPNMKILQFAFDTNLQNKFLPKNYNRNCVCYTGTHDNDTTIGWYNSASSKERLLFTRLVPQNRLASPSLRLASFGMKSKAQLVIIPLQDYLCLDTESRMNTPGTSTGNWEWRFSDGDLTEKLIKIICYITKGRD